jgi:hypothetical protein
MKETFLAVTRNKWFCMAWLVAGTVFLALYGFLKPPADYTISA